ncbi:hypothetical protein R6Q59_022927 [Mikania micrantha]
MSTGDAQIDRYQQIPTFMRDVLANYLLDNDHPNALKLHHQTPKIIDFPWKTTENGVDLCLLHESHENIHGRWC